LKRNKSPEKEMNRTLLKLITDVAEKRNLSGEGAASGRAVNRKQGTYATLKRRSTTVFPQFVFAALALLAMLLLNCSAYGQSRAVLQPESNRQAAPELNLADSEGKNVELKEYRGKIVVVDFWATWCHGCKTEIPWFAEFQRKYGANGLNVIGISMDDDGWKVVKPFIKEEGVPYRIVLGNDSIAKQYAIGNMPDTFLIDRDGRIAAAYAGVVDREDIERNIQTLLAKP
jgi:cytochrome c biogenesis protein CcmG/thiol:disulfide interchange protein DsbE